MWAVGLFAVGLVVLFAGGFVQFDDTSGFGYDQWILPLSVVSLAAAIASVVVAWTDSTARLLLGIAMTVLVAFLIWQCAVNDGFRFIWHGDEGELLQLQVVLGLTGLSLIATGLQPSREPQVGATNRADAGAGRWLVRAVVYLVGCLVAMYVAFIVGATYYEARECANTDEQCLAPLGGLVWSVIVVPVSLVAIVVIELVLRNRRKRRRS